MFKILIKPGLLILLFILQLFIVQSLYSQFSYSIHYTVNDGLPSSKIYDMIQDSRGYIWFATENGVSRYNGYRFTNFTTREGLPTNSTIKLFEDYKGRIWFLSYHGSLSYFENGSVQTLPVNSYLNQINIPFIAHLYVDSTETMWVAPFNGGLYKMGKNAQMKLIGAKPLEANWIYLYLNVKPNGYILAYIKPDTEFAEKQEDMVIVGEEEYYFGFDMDPSESHFSFLEMEESILLSFGKKVYQVEDEEIIHKLRFDKEIVGLNTDKNNNVWISEKFNGVFQYTNGIQSEPVNHFFADRTISKVLQDTEGNYWFSTTENGVHFVPSLEINTYSKTILGIENDIILALGIHGNSLYFSTDGKEVYHAKIQEEELQEFESLNLAPKLIDNIYSVLPVSDHELYATGTFSMEGRDAVQKFNSGRHIINLVHYGYNLYPLGNGDIVVSHGNGIKIFNGTKTVYISPESFNTRVFTVEFADDSSFWLGTIKGLFQLKDNVFSRAFPNDPVLNSRISVLKYQNNDLWVGSFDNGLVLMSNDSTYYIDSENGLSSNRVKSIFIENDSICWIGTNRGLNRITVSGNSRKSMVIESMDIWDGLPSNEINNIIKHEELLWLGTDNGLVSFRPDELDLSHKPARLYLQGVHVEGKGEVDLNVPTVLGYNENNITFDYSGVCFKDPESTIYTYKLEGLNSGWSETKNTSVRFHGLQPGKYTFIIQAEVFSGVLSEKVQHQFVIKKHFSQTGLFRFIVVLLAAIIVFIIVALIVMNQKKKNTLQRQIYLAEQKAMLSQMNPHFIFNSLNSIQNFILDNDGENANIYLVTFSSLIRKILDVSQKNFITLKEELETIRLYLELEKFRFDKKFDFHIEVNTSINTDNVSLPSLILQPYLENAIWHGIVPKKDHGLLQLIVNRTKEEGIVITITDDGIGRDKALEISKRRKQHKPTGIKNVEERLNLLNTLNKTNMHVEITDLFDEKKYPCGTKVDFYIDGVKE